MTPGTASRLKFGFQLQHDLADDFLWRRSTPRYPHPFRYEFGRMMEEARDADRGLWADAKQGDLPYYLRNSTDK